MSIANSPVVLCPDCGEAMTKRNSSRGAFWGCCNYPRCRGTRKVGEENKIIAPKEPEFKPIVKLPGSEEQEAIWNFLLKEKANVALNCGPGTGKTFSIVQACLRIPKTVKILLIAFNKHIAREADGKLHASGCYNVEAKTFHSWGLGVLKQHFKGTQVDEDKMTRIFEAISPAPLLGKAEWRRMINTAERLSSFVKNGLIDHLRNDVVAQIEKLADHHGMDIDVNFYKALEMVPQGLEDAKKMASVSIDLDDMCWLPYVLGLTTRFPCDLLFVDEAQDLNPLQHENIFKTITKEGRICIVGDKRQAIYAWRGANTESIDELVTRLEKTPRGCKEFPLTITLRCPKLHVQLAQTLFPNIQALDDAPLGEIFSMAPDKATEMMEPGDMVICRVNKALIHTAYALIKRGIRPLIKGRDLGKGLIVLIEKLEKISFRILLLI